MMVIFYLQKNDLDVVRALVVFDADVNCLNHLKMSPMDYTMINNNQVLFCTQP